MQTQIPCDLCNGTVSVPVFSTETSSPFVLVRCQHCGLIYLDPRPSPDEMAAYYGADYYTGSLEEVAEPHGLMQVMRRLFYRAKCADPISQHLWQRLLNRCLTLFLGWRVRRFVPPLPRGRLLDVGCGNGVWIASLRDSLPNGEVSGVETNPYAVQVAREQLYLNVYEGPLESLALTSGHYDMITLWHSLEHMSSPAQVLQECHRLLRQGGWLALEVPDISSREAIWAGATWYHLSVPQHLYHFSATTLIRLLEKSGFHISRIQPIRGSVSLLQALEKRFAHRGLWLHWGTRLLGLTAGNLSAWGLRVYAEK